MKERKPRDVSFTSTLCPEAREDANQIAKQVWIKCHKLLGGQQYRGPIIAGGNIVFSIFGGDFLRDEATRLGIDLIIMRRMGNHRNGTTDHLVFLPGHVLTRSDKGNIGIQQLTDGQWGEMGRNELLEILEQLEKTEARNVPAERPAEEMGLI